MRVSSAGTSSPLVAISASQTSSLELVFLENCSPELVAAVFSLLGELGALHDSAVCFTQLPAESCKAALRG
jgi:hypothetical protein